MRKLYWLILGLCLSMSATVFGQQDPMFTKYMFNSLTFNPAYAGSQEYMSGRIIYRNQWFSFGEGAPTTYSLTLHTPLKKKIAVGISAYADQIGAMRSNTFNFSYAYRMPLKTGTLAVALQAGFYNQSIDRNLLDERDPDDPVIEDNTGNSLWRPNVGAGIYYSTDHYYVGLGVPHLIEYDLRNVADQNFGNTWAKLYRHYYLSGGAAFEISPLWVFKPSFLIKNVGLLEDFNSGTELNKAKAPTEFDIDISFLYFDALWVGASYRSSFESFSQKSSQDSADIWAAFYMVSGLRIGAAYDLTLTELNQDVGGSFEVMLGYDFSFKVNKIVHTRYF